MSAAEQQCAKELPATDVGTVDSDKPPMGLAPREVGDPGRFAVIGRSLRRPALGARYSAAAVR